MTQAKITASAAMLNVLKTWGVDTIYGIPSGTLSSLMDALAEDKDIRFLQVRHEETGALAAVMQAKWGGSIGVAVGSGGPGATHLINGVYDAAMDNTPFLAILGSRPVNELNMDAFQELNQIQCTMVLRSTTSAWLTQRNCQKSSTKPAVLLFLKKVQL